VPRTRTAVLASGQGSNLQALLDATRDPRARCEVALVVSNRTDAPALGRAAGAGIATAAIRPDGQDASEILELLARHRIALIVLAGYLKKVPGPVVAAYRGRVLNIHPALLPGFGGPGMYGRHVHEAVLSSGARVTGATVHIVDEQYDHGPILAQWPVPVHPGDTPESLARRVLAVEHRLLPAAVLKYAELIAGLAPGETPPAHAFSVTTDCFVPSPTLPTVFTDALALS
jgi:formyltetrahydrofolate-dependent phosphoribosylglycinamide formyltransferase